MVEVTSAPGGCPFCTPASDRVFYESELVCGIWDAFPVSPGHALVVPKRHVPGWFQTSHEEKLAMLEAIEVAKVAIERKYKPDGYNIGVNTGEAAGQTIFHVHIHVIPRIFGDVEDPRGGVRYVIPDKASYTNAVRDVAVAYESTQTLLTTGQETHLLPLLREHLSDATQIDFAIAFVLPSGVELVWSYLKESLDRGGRVRILTGDYLDGTDPDALLRLIDLKSLHPTNTELRVFQTAGGIGSAADGARAFHPKTYIFMCRRSGGAAIVGSSNLSASALERGIEWNYRVIASRDRVGFAEIRRSFETLFISPETCELTSEWVRQYRDRRAVLARPAIEPIDVEPQKPPPVPHTVQRDALEALRRARAAGVRAGLVVLATGLGKTWLSAFDSVGFQKVLFVAHREEILVQALNNFRRIRPHDELGYFTGGQKDHQAAVLFASVQTLGRQSHLDGFTPEHFDYIVIDEFHHASAATYRRLIRYFKPSFLIGLTATPERSDGADLLDLCGGNLIFRCDLAEGIRQQLLCPFTYYGVPDDIDYSNIPWRSARFDERKLTQAAATQARARNALEQLRARGGSRTLAFCVSQTHADFMAQFFDENGVRAVSVHAGPTSASRTESLERLRSGDLAVICAVDMFNEGVDLPELDTVMMLRPTESRVVWLQQFGRGLRRSTAEKRLTVIDYIGNHRTFLLKPQTLFNLSPGDAAIQNLIEQLQAGTAELPPGCEVTYDLKAIDILRGLLRTSQSASEAIRAYVLDFIALQGERPTALEAYRDGYNPRSVRANYGSWFGFLEAIDLLTEEERQARNGTDAFLDQLEVTQMVKSFEMLVLLAMLDAGSFPGEIEVGTLALGVRELLGRYPDLAADFGDSLGIDERMIESLERNPIDAWIGGRGTGGAAFFRYEKPVFSSALRIEPDQVAPLQDLTRELTEWRIAEYRDRTVRAQSADYVLTVSHAGRRPILFLPDRKITPDLPEGWVPVLIDDVRYRANFVKVAVNVIQAEGSDDNELPSVLRGWFGPDAGLPGTRHQVGLTREGDVWRLAPIGAADPSRVL